MKNIPANFKSKLEMIVKVSNAHLMIFLARVIVCPAWQELMVGLDLKLIKDFIIFLWRLLLERAKLHLKREKA